MARLNMGLRRTAVVLAAALAVPACSDPKAAGEANFRKALEPVVRDAFCRMIDVDRMKLDDADAVAPWPLIVPVVALPSYEPGRKAERRMLEVASSEGLLSRSTRSASAKEVNRSGPMSQRDLIVYTPMERGKAMFRTIERRTASGTREFPGMCQARAEITSIVRWTEPADMFGQTLTQVTYRYRGVDVDASLPADVRTQLSQEKERTTTLIRASDGWQLFGRG